MFNKFVIMKRIATLPYDELNFVWISNHYDIHISGLCEMGHTLFAFQTINPHDDDNYRCEIYMLSFWEEIKWRMRKFFFEQMVGYHWTYPQRKNGANFYIRNPKWLYKFLYKLFFTIKTF
jgi:hypothetical protein